RNRMEELAAQHEIVQCEGTARGLATGALFSLTNHPRGDQNREYLIVSASHDVEDNAYESTSSAGSKFDYRGSWSAIPSTQAYRPPRLTPKPVVKGPQTAVVVGKAGEEIWTDEHGRVKVQFHWDRYGE